MTNDENDYEDKRPRERYAAETKRLLGVLEAHLAGRDWMVGNDYSIADIAIRVATGAAREGGFAELEVGRRCEGACGAGHRQPNDQQ